MIRIKLCEGLWHDLIVAIGHEMNSLGRLVVANSDAALAHGGADGGSPELGGLGALVHRTQQGFN
jgi:hypothetical protein